MTQEDRFHPENYSKLVKESDMYSGLLIGDDAMTRTKTLFDIDVASKYAFSVGAAISDLRMPASGDILDMGCGPGMIPAMLGREFGRQAWGIDMSPSAIAYGSRIFPHVRLSCGSADELGAIADGSLALAHAREFYPFTRSDDVSLHLRFIKAARPKLRADGLFIAVQVHDPSVGVGINTHWPELIGRAKRAGYRQAGRRILPPRRILEHLGAVVAFPPVRLGINMLGNALERLRPGLVSFVYWLRA